MEYHSLKSVVSVKANARFTELYNRGTDRPWVDPPRVDPPHVRGVAMIWLMTHDPMTQESWYLIYNWEGP